MLVTPLKYIWQLMSGTFQWICCTLNCNANRKGNYLILKHSSFDSASPTDPCVATRDSHLYFTRKYTL